MTDQKPDPLDQLRNRKSRPLNPEEHFSVHDIPALEKRRVRCTKAHQAAMRDYRFPEIPEAEIPPEAELHTAEIDYLTKEELAARIRDMPEIVEPPYPYEKEPTVPVGTLGTVQCLEEWSSPPPRGCYYVVIQWALSDGTKCGHLYDRSQFSERCELIPTP